MELRQLRYFIKAAETLNFSDAAKALNIAQSSLSQQIKQLEDDLNVKLFLRNSHYIRLTEAGEMMLPFALRTIHDAETCIDRIHDLQKLLTGTLNIGVTHSFSPILTETVISFMKMYPHIKLNIIYKPMGDLMELLSKRELDFVLAFKPTHPVADVESHILFQNSLCAVVSTTHPLASNDKVSLAELSKYNLALPSKGLQARNAFDNIVSDCHLRPCVLGEDGEIAPLYKVPAHADGRQGIRAQPPPDLPQLPGVAPVENVVFRHNAHNCHGFCPPLTVRFPSGPVRRQNFQKIFRKVVV